MSHMHFPAMPLRMLCMLVWRSAPQVPISSYASEWRGCSLSLKQQKAFFSLGVHVMFYQRPACLSSGYTTSKLNLHLPLPPCNSILVCHSEMCWLPRCYISSTKQLHMHWRNISTDSFLIQTRDSPADLLSVHTVCQQSTSAVGAGISNLRSSSRRSYSLLIHIMHISFFRLHCKIYRLIWLTSFHTNTHLVHSVLLYFLRNAVQRCTVCRLHTKCVYVGRSESN